MRVAKRVGVGVLALVAVMLVIGLVAPSTARAEGIDLDATYIERTPRYEYDTAKNNPHPGDTVTFTAHVKCYGASATNVTYRWQIDGATVGTGTIPTISPGSETNLSQSWSWKDGHHSVSFALDSSATITELSEQNNTVTDRTDGLAVGFWVEQSLYDYFRQHQRELRGAGSNSWEDWAQRQIAYWQQLAERAVFPATPQGVLDRLRLDKVVVVPDGSLPLHGGWATNTPDALDKTVDLQWGFPAYLLDSMYDDTSSPVRTNPFYTEDSLLHELAHARWISDTYGFDVHNKAHHGGVDQVRVWEGSTYVGGSAYLPYLAWEEVLHYCKYRGFMSGDYDKGWSEYDGAALNRNSGKRAGHLYVSLIDIPQRNHLQILDVSGRPLAGADLRLYRSVNSQGPDAYGKDIDNVPDALLQSDHEGWVDLPPNPFTGSAGVTQDVTNGVMLLRIAHQGHVWYSFQEVTDFNLAYWKGDAEDAYYTLRLPAPAAGMPLRYTVTSSIVGSGGTASPLWQDVNRGERVELTFQVEPGASLTRVMDNSIDVTTQVLSNSYKYVIDAVSANHLVAATFTPPTPTLSFPDVPSTHPYYAAVMDLASRGIVGGYTNGYFGVDDPPRRAQFAKMILGTLGILPNASTATRFTDLGAPDADGYPHIWVQAAFDHHITYGTNQAQTLFDPWRFIQRDQVVSMIVRGVTVETPGLLPTPPAGYGLFAGVPEPHGQNLRIAEYNGLLDGLVGLGPTWSVSTYATRGEVAQMLHNLLGLETSGTNSVTVRATAETGVAVAQVKKGDTLTFRASGTWYMGGTEGGGPDGIRPANADETGVLLPSAKIGMLIGRVGDQFFPIGSQATIVAPVDGQLRLFFNDRTGCYGDNSGSVIVQVTIT